MYNQPSKGDIVIDIETIANPDMAALLPPVEVKAGNLKDPVKIAEKEAEARAKQLDSMALSPLYGRVLAFQVKEVGSQPGVTKGVCIDELTDVKEVDLLELIFSQIEERRVITYNGGGFDLPFIFRRAVLLGCDPRAYNLPPLAEYLRRGSAWHVDVMAVWAGFGQYEKLDHLAGAMLGSYKHDIDFHEFGELIASEEGRRKICAYCGQDVLLTERIFQRINGILF